MNLSVISDGECKRYSFPGLGGWVDSVTGVVHLATPGARLTICGAREVIAPVLHQSVATTNACPGCIMIAQLTGSLSHPADGVQCRCQVRR
jgi:hypothetical protein